MILGVGDWDEYNLRRRSKNDENREMRDNILATGCDLMVLNRPRCMNGLGMEKHQSYRVMKQP